MYRDSYETTGSTVEAAVELAMTALGVESRDDVEVEILSESDGSADPTGWGGGSRARVRVTVKGSEEEPEATAPVEPPPDPPVAPKEEPTETVQVADVELEASDEERPPARMRRSRMSGRSKRATPRPDVVISEGGGVDQPPVAELGVAPSVARPRATYDPSPVDNEVFKDVVGEVLDAIDIEYETSFEHGDYQRASIELPKRAAGALIGRRGSAIDALEHLLCRMTSQRAGHQVPVQIDVNEYRLRREADLREEAVARAERALEDGRDYHMEPMNPRERRVVHLAVEKMDGLATYTVGEGSARHVVISRERPGDPK